MDVLQPDDPAYVGPYRLAGRLGAGGMGQVYLGQDAAGHQAAVKVIHPGHGADPDFRNRFEREITTARQVSSPWIAGVIAADPHAARPWLATAYIPGPDLQGLVTGAGVLPEAVVAGLAARLAQALVHLHAAGVVHRDLKPSNVLIAPDGPRLIDFGIARAADATKITTTGVVIGTPAFMSPEQALGTDIGPPSDVFSLAAVLTFAATGTGPFGQSTGNPVAMLRRVTSNEPDLTRVPAALRGVLASCLAKDPAARPTADRLAASLAPMDLRPGQSWLPPTLAAAVTHRTGGPGGARRRRGGILAAAAAVAAVLVVGAAAVVVGNPLVTGGDGAAPPVVAAGPTTTTTATAPAPPRTFPSGPPSAPPSAAPIALLPSVVPGWIAATSTTRNAAYDVPPPWVPESPDAVKGYRNTEGQPVVMSGVAVHPADGLPPCRDRDRHLLSWAGVTGDYTPDHAVAARNMAAFWTGFYDDGKGAPQAGYGAPRAVTVNGQAASHVVTDITANAACGSGHNVIHTIAVPDGKGQSVVLVILAQRDVPGALSDADVDRIISTLRPAGLEAKCDATRDAVGSWC